MFELKDLEFKILTKDVYLPFIKTYHYSRSCRGATLAVGAYYKDKLMNCIVYNIPTVKEMAPNVWHDGNSQNTWELIRMVSMEPKPKNMESYCIHKSFDIIKKQFPNIKVIISYADGKMGHHGYCYQASGFTYYGESRAVQCHYLDGVKVHERNLKNKFGTYNRKKIKEEYGDRYYIDEDGTTKSRYYYILSQNKKEKKEILSKIKVPNLPYPKGDNKKYDIYNDNGFAYKEAPNNDNIERGEQFA